MNLLIKSIEYYGQLIIHFGKMHRKKSIIRIYMTNQIYNAIFDRDEWRFHDKLQTIKDSVNSFNKALIFDDSFLSRMKQAVGFEFFYGDDLFKACDDFHQLKSMKASIQSDITYETGRNKPDRVVKLIEFSEEIEATSKKLDAFIHKIFEKYNYTDNGNNRASAAHVHQVGREFCRLQIELLTSCRPQLTLGGFSVAPTISDAAFGKKLRLANENYLNHKYTFEMEAKK